MWNAGQREAIKLGASVSHHHGIGISRARFMQESLGSAMQLLQGLKNALDPKDSGTQAKLVSPHSATTASRYGRERSCY